jgi:hypothetical protein
MILWVLVMGFLVLGGNYVLQLEDPTSRPSFRPTTVAPTPSPSSSPTTLVPTYAPTSREAYVKTTLRKFFAHKADFTHTKAYKWMIETDTFQPEEETMILERFALAHLYFELNGHDWKFNPSWLTSKSICDWHRKETFDKEFWVRDAILTIQRLRISTLVASIYSYSSNVRKLCSSFLFWEVNGSN